MTNKCETDVNATREKLYEETKYMSSEEHIKRVNDKAQKLAEEFGFIIVQSANANKITRNVS